MSSLVPVSASGARPRTQRGWRALAMRIAFLALLAMIVIGLNPLSERIKTIPATGDGDSTRQLVYIVIGLLAFIATPLARKGRALAIPASLAIGLLWCWISVSWAIEPSVSIRRLLLTTLIIWTVFRAVDEIGYEQSVWSMRVVLLITLVLNYIAIAVTPAAIHHATEALDSTLVGNWRGILPHKNFAGAICAFTVIVFAFDARRLPIAGRVLILLATAYFLYRTQSKTSMGILVAALAAGFLYMRYNPTYRMLLIPAVVVAACVVVVQFQAHWEGVTASISDPTAFTGRGAIWSVLFRYSADHPMLGTGFGSFWNIGPSSPSFEYARGWVATIGNGHNGYLDLLTQIGVPGLLVVVLGAFVWPITQLLASTSASRQQGALVMAMVIFCAGHNMTESSLLERDTIVELFLMIAIALSRNITQPLAPPPRRRAMRTVHRPLGAARQRET